MKIYTLHHMLPLLQHMLVFLGLAYLFTKTRVFEGLVSHTLKLPDRAIIFLVFSGFCILGTIFSEPSASIVAESGKSEAIANTRAIGAVLGGLLGGPIVGFMVGVVGGVHRLWLMSCTDYLINIGGSCEALDPINYIDISCAVATTAEGLLAGLLQYYWTYKNKPDKIFLLNHVFLITFCSEIGHMLTLLIFGWFADMFLHARGLVSEIALPMMIANATGASIIMYMLKEQRDTLNKQKNSKIAWNIANQAAEVVDSKFDQSASKNLAKIIKQETQVSAVSITNKEKLLAFIGEGDDHHLPGDNISSIDTRNAINENRVVVNDGINKIYQCAVENDCPLKSAMVIPLQDVKNDVFGTVKLYETKKRLFSNINLELGNNIADLLSRQFISGELRKKGDELLREQFLRLNAQIDPHFLFNTFNDICYQIEENPKKAHRLLLALSNMVRGNIRTQSHTITLKKDIEHMENYLFIVKSRYGDGLYINLDIPQDTLDLKVPVFTLQPMVENAVKHGKEKKDILSIFVQAAVSHHLLTLSIKDDAGAFVQPDTNANGIGLNLNKRIAWLYGPEYGLSIKCERDKYTLVSIRLPENETRNYFI